MMTDLYQLTMMYGYFRSGTYRNKAVFDLFFRNNGQLNYAVAAGLEQAIDFVRNIRFDNEDIAYLRSLGIFGEDFLKYLSSFRFSGDIYAVKEGTIVFAHEPILIVHADLIEAQFVETALLNIINHQTLIATKASNIVIAAEGKTVVEFGLRRAQGPDAGIYGARAAIIGGCDATSNVLSAQKFGLEVRGTHAHSWVMSFPSELEAFRAYAELYPDECLLLVDTFDTLKSGIPNAIKIFDELRKKGHSPKGIRIDSGDLAYLSKKARSMLDAAGYTDAKIMVSGDIDEQVISSLKLQGAEIDIFGIGTKLITSERMPSLGGVYKLAAVEIGGKLLPKMKVSDSNEKTTNPGFKELYRIYEKESGKAFADLIALKGEAIPKPLTLIHPTDRWKRTVLEDYGIRQLLVKVMSGGRLVTKMPSIEEICRYAETEMDTFWNEYKRQINPHIYKVDLSDGLFELKQKFLARE